MKLFRVGICEALAALVLQKMGSRSRECLGQEVSKYRSTQHGLEDAFSGPLAGDLTPSHQNQYLLYVFKMGQMSRTLWFMFQV